MDTFGAPLDQCVSHLHTYGSRLSCNPEYVRTLSRYRRGVPNDMDGVHFLSSQNTCFWHLCRHLKNICFWYLCRHLNLFAEQGAFTQCAVWVVKPLDNLSFYWLSMFSPRSAFTHLCMMSLFYRFWKRNRARSAETKRCILSGSLMFATQRVVLRILADAASHLDLYCLYIQLNQVL